MARKATEIEKTETDAIEAIAPTADNLFQLAANTVAAGKRQVFVGTIGLAMARVAAVKGWNGGTVQKAPDFDETLSEQIDGSRATVFRVKAMVKALSARLDKDHGAAMATARDSDTADAAVQHVVATLAALGVTDLTSLAAYLKKEGKGAEKASMPDQVAAWMLGTEKRESRIGEFTAEQLQAIASAISAELSGRQAQADQTQANAA